MVPSVARQSVILKCNMQKSVLTGNYEFYYAAGLLAKLTGIAIPEDIRPPALAAVIKKNGQEDFHYETANISAEKMDYLRQMLLDYMPKDEYDLQMKELLLWGMGEERMFQV